MLRTGIATLMICAVSAPGVMADDAEHGGRTVMEWLSRGGQTQRSSGVRQANGHRAHSAGTIRQTSDQMLVSPSPGAPLNPLPIQLPPVLPNASPVSGPQYFSVSGTQSIAQPVHPGRNWQQYQAPQPVHRTSRGVYTPIAHGVAAHQSAPGVVVSQHQSGAPLSPGTALYPAPRPGIPHQVGGTAISNQFLNPHEMLYAHQYKAMYPPYSYKVNGKWMVTPFGVWSHEDWHLQGTMVDVKYKSHISPFAMFTPPVRR